MDFLEEIAYTLSKENKDNKEGDFKYGFGKDYF